MGQGLPKSADKEPDFIGFEFRGLRSVGRNAEIIRAFPWSLTPLGPLERWDANFLSSLDLLLDARFAMFLCWGKDLHLFYNEAFETALVGKGDCIGRPVSSVFPEVWPDVRAYFDKALEGQGSYVEDLPLMLVRDSKVAPSWWSLSYSPVRAEDGSVGGVLAVVYETTSRVSAEVLLKEREADLIAVTDAVPNLLWRADADGRFTWVNPALENYFNLTVAANVRWNDHVHPDDIEPAAHTFSQCLAAGRPFETQQRLLGADGRSRWFVVKAQQILDDDGQVSGWCGSATDIDDWHRAADQQADREEMLHRFYESNDTLMWVGQVATRQIQALNPDIAAVWSMPENGVSVNWESWIEFAHPDDRPLLSSLFDKAASGDIAQARFRSVSPDGSVRRFHITGFAMPCGEDGAKRVGGMVVEVASADAPRIYLVDAEAGLQNPLAQSLTRKGFRVRTFIDLVEFQKNSADLAPGCVVLAVHADVEPILRTGAVLRTDRRLPWIAIGDISDRLHDVVQLMKLGAADILNNPDTDAIAAASHAALAVAFGKAAESRAPADARQKMIQLSQRERQVLEGLVAGGTNKSIAKALDLSPRTVETYRAQLMDRLGVSTLAELVKLAAESRIGSIG